MKERGKRAQGRQREQQGERPIPAGPVSEAAFRELQILLDEGLNRLPEKYRTPFVLCCLEGKSKSEAARELDWKEGTVSSRLAQARKKLQQFLSQKGVSLAAVLTAAAMAENAATACVSPLLAASAFRAAMLFASGSSVMMKTAKEVQLAEAVLRSMAALPWKTATALLLTVCLVAGATGLMHHAETAKQTPSSGPPKATQSAAQIPARQEEKARRDRYGDLLPNGAIARLGTVRWRHGYQVTALAYSPNGKMIATTGFGQGVMLWDVSSGKLVHKFPQQSQPGGSVAFSSDGAILAAGDWQVCHLWDVATGKELRRLKSDRQHVASVAFAPDGKIVAGVDQDGGTLRLWEKATGTQLRHIECNQGVLWAVAFSPDGRRLATGGVDGAICLWDSHTGKELHRWKAHQGGVTKILLSPDGKRMLSSASGVDKTVREWDTATCQPLRTFGEKRRGRLPIALSTDGTLLASGEADGQIRVWDMASGEEKRRWSTGSAPLWAVAFSPDGKTIASAVDRDVNIHFWDRATGRELHPSQEHVGPIHVLRYSPDEKTLVSAGADMRMLWWDLSQQMPRRQFTWSAKDEEHTFALSPDGNLLADASMLPLRADPDRPIQLWDVRNGKPGLKLVHSGQRLSAIAFSPDGRLLATGGEDESVTLWDGRNGNQVRQLKGMSRSVKSLCFSPDGKMLAVGLRGNLWNNQETNRSTLQVWNVASGNEIRSFNVHDTFTALAFSPDGQVLASGNGYQHEAFVRLWDIQTGAELCRHTGHRESSGAIAFSPDGKLVASGTGGGIWLDNSLHVWEAVTGRLIQRFEGHYSCVGAMVFSPDGLTVASGAGDSTILLWDITGRRAYGRWHAKQLTPRQLDACWATLADEDAAKAYGAVWALAAAPEQAVHFLQKHFPPVLRADAETVARLIADLDSDDFAVRQKATEELSKLGEAVAFPLRHALDSKPSFEVRRRIQQLLDQTRDWTTERLRDHRAIQALEHIGTRQAKEVLQALAKGASEARRSEEAKAALLRLGR